MPVFLPVRRFLRIRGLIGWFHLFNPLFERCESLLQNSHVLLLAKHLLVQLRNGAVLLRGKAFELVDPVFHWGKSTTSPVKG